MGLILCAPAWVKGTEPTRPDPRWVPYDIKIVLAGKGGQYLGDANITVSKSGSTCTGAS